MTREQIIARIEQAIRETRSGADTYMASMIAANEIIAAHGAQAECGKSSGEAVAWEIASPEGERPALAFLTSKMPTKDNYESQGWRVTPLYLAAPQHSADIYAMRAHLTASSRDTWIRLSGRPMIEGSLAHAFAVWLIDAAIDEALQDMWVA